MQNLSVMHMVLYVQEVEKQYKQHVAEGGASDELRFSYAVYLIKSDLKNDIRKGIRLMESELRRLTMSNSLLVFRCTLIQ